jgi:hypothetical protein
MDNNDKLFVELINHILLTKPNLVNVIERISNEIATDLKLKVDGSYCNERSILENYVSQLRLSSGFVVDIAASDGFTQSCTLGLFSRAGWNGLAVEMDSRKFSELAKLYSRFSGAKLARCRVTPSNVVELLRGYEVESDLTVLNLDIDSYDLHVIKSILSAGYAPLLITMEINEKIPPGIFFSVDYHSDHAWAGDHFFGCSIDAACYVVKPFGYKLVHLEYNNAFFVRTDLNLITDPDLDAKSAYFAGYQNRNDREQFFPWNSNVDHWMQLARDDAIKAVSAFFGGYQGLFTLAKSEEIFGEI